MAIVDNSKMSPALPGSPSTGSVVKKIWTLYYRGGRNPMPMTKHFGMEGSIEQVVARCKEHCMTMGNRFVRVEPFLSDLRVDEQNHAGSDSFEDLVG